MSSVLDRFLRYVSMDTASDPDSDAAPSTKSQFALANLLVQELRALGLKDVRIDDFCCVYATIPATDPSMDALGFIAHMDTSPDAPGANIKPRIVQTYDGGPIVLTSGLTLSPQEFPELLEYRGEDLVVTDGTTLLGADDKAGIAEIMTLVERLTQNPLYPRGKICIGFTPDEEIGRGVDHFDLAAFGADFAYTVDGGKLGEVEYENFNAASALVTIHGKEIHPGSAKGRMINALTVGMELDRLLPAAARPEYTEGYEGFFHLVRMHGTASQAALEYILRDHDKALFERRKRLMEQAVEWLCQKYGYRVAQVETEDSYYNMKEKVLPHWKLIETAQQAMESQGIKPITNPIRGGTDGAMLSHKGLPCPNLSTGGHNPHSRLEYIPVQSMERMCDVLEQIVRIYYGEGKHSCPYAR